MLESDSNWRELHLSTQHHMAVRSKACEKIQRQGLELSVEPSVIVYFIPNVQLTAKSKTTIITSHVKAGFTVHDTRHFLSSNRIGGEKKRRKKKTFGGRGNRENEKGRIPGTR